MNSSSSGDTLVIKVEQDQDDHDNCDLNHPIIPEIFVKCEVNEEVENHTQSDPSHLKAETQDTNEQFISNASPREILENGNFQSERFVFRSGDVIFEELANGKVKCGSCFHSFERILRHINYNPNCALNIDFDEFKKLWTKYKNKQTNRRKEQKKKLDNLKRKSNPPERKYETFILNPSQIQLLEKRDNQSERFFFKRGNVIFQQLPDGKVRCGSCKYSFGKILLHLTSNPTCILNFNFSEFKTLWLRHKHKQSKARYEQRKKLKNSELILREQAEMKKKYELMKKVENHDQFLKNQAEPSHIEAEYKDNCDWNHTDKSDDFVCEIENKVENIIEIDPLQILAETEDTKEDQIIYNPSQLGLPEDGYIEHERFMFQKGDVIFEELPNGKVRCGSCMKSFTKIVGHLANTPACALNIDLKAFKAERKRKYEQKKRAENPEEWRKKQMERCRKYEQRKRAQDPEKFRQDKAQNLRNHRKKAQNIEQFLNGQVQETINDVENKKEERVYTCPLCNRDFGIKSNVKRHLFHIHKVTGSEDFMEQFNADVKDFDTSAESENIVTEFAVESLKVEVEVDPIADFEEYSYENTEEDKDESYSTDEVYIKVETMESDQCNTSYQPDDEEVINCKGCRKSYTNFLRHVSSKNFERCKPSYSYEELKISMDKAKETSKKRKRERNEKYRQTESAKAKQRERVKRYRQTEIGKAKQKERDLKYRQTEGGKAKQKERDKRYRQTESGKTKQKERDKRYRQREGEWDQQYYMTEASEDSTENYEADTDNFHTYMVENLDSEVDPIADFSEDSIGNIV